MQFTRGRTNIVLKVYGSVLCRCPFSVTALTKEGGSGMQKFCGNLEQLDEQ